ncbi:unnamed protein product [Notodromas monacha]|uniref:RPGRIP1 C-terminal domain-containing protein n=1 Tax=Notodromas monacha TaxID=399045 RepID=A0A7R9GDG3_9CRUS|nr:unnamed protein product [Notodromas monacha]CAG0916895.1 unnamed protein product [Notodromas monacha]
MKYQLLSVKMPHQKPTRVSSARPQPVDSPSNMVTGRQRGPEGRRRHVDLRPGMGGPQDLMAEFSQKAVQLLEEAKEENLQLGREVEDLKLQVFFLYLVLLLEKPDSFVENLPFFQELETGCKTNVQVLKLQAELSSRDQLVASLRTQLLEEAKEENLQLGREVEDLKLQLVNRETELEDIREQFQKKEMEHDEELFGLRKQLLEGKKEELETGCKTNVQVLKLQAELSSRDQLVASLRTQKANSGLIAQIEDLGEQLSQEQSRSLQLQERLRMVPSLERGSSELQSQCKSLMEENRSLREANEQLVSAAFEREAELTSKERKLAEKLADSERQLHSELGDLRYSFEQALKEKTRLLSDYETAERRLRTTEEQLQFLKVNAELEKTRTLLIVQHKLNEGYDKEVTAYKRRLTDLQKVEASEKQKLKSAILVKDKKLSDLETQLRTLYISSSTPPESLIDQLVVSRDQTVLCLHLERLDLLNTLPDPSEDCSSRILAIAFLNKWFFRIQLDSPNMSSYDLQTTAFYRMSVDPGVREKIESDRAIKMEIRDLTAGNSKSKLVAECDLSLRDLLRFPDNRLHGTATLFQAMRPSSATTRSKRLYDLEVSHVHYWVRWVTGANKTALFSEPKRPTPAARQKLRHPIQESSYESTDDEIVSVKPNFVRSEAVKDDKDFVESQQRKASVESSLPESDIDEQHLSSLPDSRIEQVQEDMRTPATMTFIVHHLNLSSNTSLTTDRKPGDKIFVEFEFPYVDQEELQTPEAQLISTISPMEYNFTKVIPITESQKEVIKSGIESNKALVRFTVVLEPAEEALECEDVGVALVDLGVAFREKKDLVETDVPVVCAENPAETVGSLRVSYSMF